MTEQFVPQGLAISQVACVVHDIDEAMERYHEALGWGPWNVYEHVPPSLHDTHYMGKPAEFSMIGAEVDTGSIVFELLQPLDGPSIYKDWLNEHGEGLHHVAVMRHTPDESDALKDHFAAMGAKPTHGRADRRDHRVLLPRHRADAQGDHRVGSGHAIDLKPVRQYP